MSPPPAWFERRFEFNFPAEFAPNLLARLRGTASRLEEALDGRAPGLLTAKPSGNWSIQEHAGHLLDLEALWMARVEDFAALRDRLTPADLTNRKTHEANHNARPLGEILAAFRTAREALVARVRALDPALLTRSMVHPRLGAPMRLVDHLFFAAEHDDHHLAQIWSVLDSAR